MIPPIIHFCWFGGNPLPEYAIKCIASWKKYFPEYEIKEWNENNFNINCNDYVKEAYKEKKWAFISDYARFWIIYHEGGIYFDTDVEVIKDMSHIVKRGPFMGCEECDKLALGFDLGVNPGLGIGANSGLTLYKEILEYYDKLHFSSKDGRIPTVVDHTTKILIKHGWNGERSISKVAGVYIYPPEYFAPYNYDSGELNLTNQTLSIHHYKATWHTWLEDRIINIERCNKKKQPIKYKVSRIISFPFRVANKLQNLGFIGMFKFVYMKITREIGKNNNSKKDPQNV